MRNGLKAIVWFNEVGKEDIPLVGGKGANLGEMTRSGIPVPPGFVITADAYYHFIKGANLADKIHALLSPLNYDDSKALQQASADIKQLIMSSPIPTETVEAIQNAYAAMGEGLVAVRSSATAEDLPDASFAGQQETFLNIHGIDNILHAIREVFASLYNDRAISYRVHSGYDDIEVALSAGVQRMVRSDLGASGVMFTLDTESGFRDVVFITSSYGLG